jgi:MFS family permease
MSLLLKVGSHHRKRNVDNWSIDLMTSGRTLIFAIAGGAAVGNLYWEQPLLGDVGETFGLPAASAGLLVMLTQIGYALGVFFIVPMGEIVNRKRIIPIFMSLSACSLAASEGADLRRLVGNPSQSAEHGIRREQFHWWCNWRRPGLLLLAVGWVGCHHVRFAGHLIRGPGAVHRNRALAIAAPRSAESSQEPQEQPITEVQ